MSQNKYKGCDDITTSGLQVLKDEIPRYASLHDARGFIHHADFSIKVEIPRYASE